jgi:hypothetical protein
MGRELRVISHAIEVLQSADRAVCLLRSALAQGRGLQQTDNLMSRKEDAMHGMAQKKIYLADESFHLRGALQQEAGSRPRPMRHGD